MAPEVMEQVGLFMKSALLLRIVTDCASRLPAAEETGTTQGQLSVTPEKFTRPVVFFRILQCAHVYV